MMKGDKILIGGIVVCLLAIGLFMLPTVFAIEPNGAELTPGDPERMPVDTINNHSAYAGNITYLGIYASAITQSWQGYYGNITGVIQLADANDMAMYNWTVADPAGEVYASTNSSINWANIQCFNYSADETYADEAGQGGTTSLYGVNLTTLNLRFGLNTSDLDAVEDTFLDFNHNPFFTASKEFSENECLSAHLYGGSGAGADSEFEEILMYEPVTGSIIFNSIIEEGGLNGFNGANNDFQMMVLENGHGTNTDYTTYFFFVEIE